MARMRNRLVHHYEDIAAERVHEVLATWLGDFDRFAEQVLGYADRSSHLSASYTPKRLSPPG